ncbi:MAG: sugar O-acetyltransferase [Actinomycetota bacterium]|nr:sugar O-acetyltransferase [Actinomycetota bacterium]
MSERERMLGGEPYDALDPELVAGRRAARALILELNAELDEARRMAMLAGIFGTFGEGTFVEAPIFFDYGANIEMGRDCFVNANVVILDPGLVRIGDRTQLATGVQVLTADHPREADRRAAGIELARPVTIDEDCWIGAGAIVCPGVEVGAGSVIGAGSVVTRDVPARVVAVGNPCRVIREL